MGNESLYLEANQEIESNNHNEALWTKSLTLSDGDTEKAKYAYIRMRVEQLEEASLESPLPEPDNEPTLDQKEPVAPPKKQEHSVNNQASASSMSIEEPDLLEYIPVDDYALLNGLNKSEVIQMIRNGQIMGRTIDNAWFVIRESVQTASSKNLHDGPLFARLIDGDFGLAKTYWLFGALVGFLWSFPVAILQFTGHSTFSNVLLFVHLGYSYIVMAGVWSAANRYDGLKLWAILAKISVVLGVLSTGVALTLFVKGLI